MSIARHFLREFRPFFQMLDEPLTRSPIAFARSRSLFDDPFFTLNRSMMREPAVDVSEAANGKYVVEAELPGVKKENIEGKLLATTEGENRGTAGEGSTQLSTEQSNQISTERSVIGNFSRTVFLPRPVDSDKVAAKLEDGILRITLSKAEDRASVSVSVE
ncbi:HSP20-like chaperone [Mycena vulgaris]|nr:HSP20-like chaperone [Mycena vulgaris]